jgi:hypothetical protein
MGVRRILEMCQQRAQQSLKFFSFFFFKFFSSLCIKFFCL